MPTLALNMMVRNAAAYAPRAIASALPHVDELVVTDTGSSDNGATKRAITEYWKQNAPGKRLVILDFNAQTHPESYIRDVSETYQNLIPKPFSDKLIMADWAKPRQMAHEASTCDYITFLDSDDVIAESHKLRDLIVHMEKNGNLLALCPYLYRHDTDGNVTTQHYRNFTARRDETYWLGFYHELLTCKDEAKTAQKTAVYNNPIIIDLHDHKDPINRVSNRGLKIVLYHYLKNPKTTDPRILMILGFEAAKTLPDLSFEVLGRYVTVSKSRVHMALAISRRGNYLEKKEDFAGARLEYQRALEIFHCCPEAAFGLARQAFFDKNYQDTVDWTRKGLEMSSQPQSQILMHSPVERQGHSRIFMALAQAHLGDHDSALHTYEEGKNLLPNEYYGLRQLLDKKAGRPITITGISSMPSQAEGHA